MRRFILVLAACLLPACAAVPEPPALTPPPAATPAPPCTSDAHRAFDFWIGEWNVFAATGALAGTNSIQPAESGCLLVEHWAGVNGITGQSYNFLDPATDKWRQIWVSGGAVIELTGGLTPAGAMKLEGTIAYQGGGAAVPFTGEWTRNPDGSVTQHFEQFDPVKNAWTPWFTGTYIRQPAD